MSFTINQDEVKETVAGIVAARKISLNQLFAAEGVIRKNACCIRNLKAQLLKLKAGVADLVDADVCIRNVYDTCSEYIKLADELSKESEKCGRKLDLAKEHFQRDAFCVAMAGGSQAGKSTTLQKAVGMDEELDPTCPIVGGGTGNSTTATRCRIVNIGTNERSHAHVEFFKQADFFSSVVNPYCRELQRMGLPLPNMDSYDDFWSFDIRKFEAENVDVLSALGNGELKDSVKAQKYYTRFCLLRNKIHEYGDLLGNAAENVEIENAYKYLVYPSARPAYNNMPSKCYAVREVTIYCRYPNPVVESIEFFDLPGSGEVAPDVEKRYAEGFNLKTDTVVYVSRFDGRIYGNADISMVDILGQVVPLGQLDNYMIHFQNDFHQVSGDVNKLIRAADINKGSKKDAYVVVGRKPSIKIYRVPAKTDTAEIQSDISRYEVSDIGSEGIVIVFGEGNDADYVSNSLLPLICIFAAKRLPVLDRALLAKVQEGVSYVTDAFERLLASVKDALLTQGKKIPSTQDTFATSVNRRVEKLRNALRLVRSDIETDYRSGKLLGETVDCASTVKAIKEALLSEIDNVDSGLLLETSKEGVLNRIRNAEAQNYGRSGQIERYLRVLRVSITERFAHLEDVYAKSIEDIVRRIFTRLRDCDDGDSVSGVPFLSLDSGRGVENWLELVQDAGCDELAKIAADLQKLEIRFYVTVYPEIRKRVFKDAVTDVYKRCFASCNTAESCYAVFHDLAENWIYESGDCIVNQNAAYEIVFSAVDRFFERTLFAEAADDEMHRLVSFFWNDFSQSEDSPLNLVKTRLNAFQTAINNMKGL